MLGLALALMVVVVAIMAVGMVLMLLVVPAATTLAAAVATTPPTPIEPDVIAPLKPGLEGVIEDRYGGSEGRRGVLELIDALDGEGEALNDRG